MKLGGAIGASGIVVAYRVVWFLVGAIPAGVIAHVMTSNYRLLSGLALTISSILLAYSLSRFASIVRQTTVSAVTRSSGRHIKGLDSDANYLSTFALPLSAASDEGSHVSLEAGAVESTSVTVTELPEGDLSVLLQTDAGEPVRYVVKFSVVSDLGTDDYYALVRRTAGSVEHRITIPRLRGPIDFALSRHSVSVDDLRLIDSAALGRSIEEGDRAQQNAWLELASELGESDPLSGTIRGALS